MLRGRVTIIILVWGWVVLSWLLAARPALSQSTPTPAFQSTGVDLGPDELVYWRPGGFWVLNRTTLEETLLYPYTPELDFVQYTTTLDRSRNRIYVLEIEGGPNQFNNAGHIVQIDLASGNRLVVWSGPRIREFTLSPDGTKMIVKYHFPLGKHERIVDSVIGYCILTIATGDCRDITDALPRNISIEWLDDETLISRLDRLYLIDIESLEWQSVPDIEDWVFRDYVILPGRRLFINAYRKSDDTTRHFVELDLDTLELVQFPAESRHYGINSLSPDEQHIIYGARVFGSGSGEQTVDVLDLQSGDYFTITLTNYYEIAWFPDSQGALMLTAPSTSGKLQQNDVLYIDLLNKEIRELGSYLNSLYQEVYILNQ